MKNKRLLTVAAVLCLASAAEAASPAQAPARKLKIVTTIFPLYDMARAIGGDRAGVTLLLPPGMEAHAFEPKPGDLARINEADLFIYTGKLMEPWAEDILESVTNKDLLAVDAGRGVPPAPADPHIWLDFDNAKRMAGNISAALGTKDPPGLEFYRKSSAVYKRKLSALDSSYGKGLSVCASKEIIYGGHYAFGYLARRYGLQYRAAQGFAPDSEPTAKDLAALVEQVRKDKIKYIFYEELSSPKIAETIAGETGAGMLLLNAAHNLGRDQVERGVSFFDILQQNLETLRKGLECK